MTDLPESAAPERWSPERAHEWYDRQPWIVGANFFPSTAVNSIEMWRAETFDPDTIRRELGWAQDLGMNSVRVFINYLAWDEDRGGFSGIFDSFLDIASSVGIRTVPVLFDDCALSDLEPRPGPQPPSTPGVFTSAWVASLPPGGSATPSPEWADSAQPYVADLVSKFGDDERVLLWDLYNEPVAASLPLIEAVFAWARAESPAQPLASCFAAEDVSDLMNVHNYSPLHLPMGPVTVEETTATFSPLVDHIAKARESGRPVIVTEWLARHLASRPESHLSFFHREKIAIWNWGLVNGKMNTHLTWPFVTQQPPVPAGAPDGLWFHDLLHADGTPYSQLEADNFRFYTGSSRDIWG